MKSRNFMPIFSGYYPIPQYDLFLKCICLQLTFLHKGEQRRKQNNKSSCGIPFTSLISQQLRLTSFFFFIPNIKLNSHTTINRVAWDFIIVASSPQRVKMFRRFVSDYSLTVFLQVGLFHKYTEWTETDTNHERTQDSWLNQTSGSSRISPAWSPLKGSPKLLQHS